MASRSLTQSYTWVFAFMGVVSIRFGLAALLWPGETLGVLVLLVGLYFVVSGILSLIYAFNAIGQHLPWWPPLLIGIVSLVAGVFVLTNPAISAVTLLYVVAFWAILSGMLEISVALVTARFLWLLAGVLSIVVGFILLSNPRAGALALVMVIGIYAIVQGIVFLVDAFRRPEIPELRIY